MATVACMARRSSALRFVLAAVLAVTAAACSGDDGGAESTEPSTTSADSEPDTAAPDTAAPDTTPDTTDVSTDDFQATIRRTSDGVPHIVANDIGGLMFGQGWASAEDYACTLADQMLKVQGRRAAALGAGADGEHVESDFAWRAIGIDALAREDYPNASEAVQLEFEAFAAGWNASVESIGVDNLQGWCAGAEWVTPIAGIDLYAYARSIALAASSAQLAQYISDAQPPGAAGATSDDGAAGPVLDEAAPLASNAWAIGSERSAGGGGMLVANPHFPWEGELRFWENHLTVPGEIDAYGVNLTGLPGLGIGFTEGVAWTHTVSAGKRLTAYTLTLAPGDPTSYVVDGEVVPMTSEEFTIDVLGDDGTLAEETRTMWRSEYGPIVNFPGLGWTDSIVLTFRDANLDNDEFMEQYSQMFQAKSLDDLIALHEEYQAVPLFNTIAVGADGRAWYADVSATPNLTAEAEAAYVAALETDALAQVARDNGFVLLDGSLGINRWEEQEGARDPGLVPWSELPMLTRDDFVFNANDSFWLANPDELVEGSYSLLHGAQRTERSWRTRENATILSDTSAEGPSGADGKFTLDELAAAAVQNTGFTSRVLLDEVLARCEGNTAAVAVPASEDTETGITTPAATVDVSEACTVLGAWDRRYDVDSRGAALWREVMYAFQDDEGLLWVNPFDPSDPVGTPSGIAPLPADAPDPVLVNLGVAVQRFTSQGVALDTPLGDMQFTVRSGERIPIHGGGGIDGVTNIVTENEFSSSTEPLPDMTGEDESDWFPITYGTSFLMVVDFSGGEPNTQVFLTYGNTEDRDSPLLDEATTAFSEKEWRTVAFTEEEIESDPDVVVTEVSGNAGGS